MSVTACYNEGNASLKGQRMVIADQLTQKTIISAAEFAVIADEPQYDGVRIELVEGEIITMSKPKALHTLVCSLVHRELDRYAMEHGGIAVVGEGGIVTKENPDGRDTVRGLDIGLYRAGRFDEIDYDDFLRTPPDIAVEVMSPHNEAPDTDQKIVEYQAMGCPFVWIVIPQTRSVMVYEGKVARRHVEGDTITGGDLLPDFAVAVADLFPPQRPAPQKAADAP